MALFQPDAVSFILFLAICPSLLAMLFAVFINKVPAEYHEQDSQNRVAISKHKRFAAVYCIVVVIALTGMVSAIWSAEHHVVGTTRRVAMVVLMVLLALMLLIPLSSGPCLYPSRRRMRQEISNSRTQEGSTILAIKAENFEEPLLSAKGKISYAPHSIHFEPFKVAVCRWMRS